MYAKYKAIQVKLLSDKSTPQPKNQLESGSRSSVTIIHIPLRSSSPTRSPRNRQRRPSYRLLRMRATSLLFGSSSIDRHLINGVSVVYYVIICTLTLKVLVSFPGLKQSVNAARRTLFTVTIDQKKLPATVN